MRSKIFISLVLLLCIFFLTGCSKNDEQNLNQKVTSELDYLSSQIVEMLNSLNHISFEKFKVKSEELSETENSSSSEGRGGESSSTGTGESQQGKSSNSGGDEEKQETSKSENSMVNNKVITMEETSYLLMGEKEDWNEVKIKIEALIEVWSQIVIDLRQIGVEEKDISEIEDQMNKLVVSIKDEKKIETALGLSNIYSYIPKFLETYSDDKLEIYLKKIKSKVIDSYAVLEQDDWAKAKQNVQDAKGFIQETKNIAKEKNERVYNVEKLDVLLQELENSMREEDKNIYYIRYKNLMSER
ncbi:MAG: hypothetical protein Q4G05_04230 [Clostridia bacterium]|nr:hypothetical protein [Clostridia bacterium]